MQKFLRIVFWVGVWCLPIYDYWNKPDLEQLVWGFIFVILFYIYSFFVLWLLEIGFIGKAIFALFGRNYGVMFMNIGYGLFFFIAYIYLVAPIEKQENVYVEENTFYSTENDFEPVWNPQPMEHEYIDLWHDDRL